MTALCEGQPLLEVLRIRRGGSLRGGHAPRVWIGRKITASDAANILRMRRIRP
jgi:hypothetical protein